ncbi:MAG: xanthine dehydrogenase [Bacillota bacterium]|nr:xanthine dehydrogenase [Bacillota bacterium]
MENNIFKKTEQALYDYKSLEVKIKNLNIDIESLKNDYSGIAAITYGEKTGATNKFNSSVENEVINREENAAVLIKKLEGIKLYNINLKNKIDNALETLDETELTLVQLRYFHKPKKTWISIAEELRIDKDYCCKVKNCIINKLSDLIYSF